MKHLALSWADGTSDELSRRFRFIFHLTLKDIKGDQIIENIIIEQHKGLKRRKVRPDEIKNIIEGNHQVLLIMDGHDEYKPGSNKYIDEAITKDSLPDCWMVLTSRETKELVRIRDYMDAEAEITGFNWYQVKEYATKYLGSTEKCEEFLATVEKKGLINRIWYDYGILCVPLLLHMICFLFVSQFSLPKSATGIIFAIIERCPDWEEIRKCDKKKEKDVRDALIRLGEFVFKKLQGHTQVFEKVNEFKPVVAEILFLLNLKLFQNNRLWNIFS